jgi:hypothetical protein
MVTKYTPDKLQHHLRYEINMLNASYALIYQIRAVLERGDASDSQKWAAQNAMIEDFCLHARLLLEFFYDRKQNSASRLSVPAYRRPDRPKDLVQKLNNQIAHMMENRTEVEAEKIGAPDRAALLRWIDTELERWRPLRDGLYKEIAIPSVDLRLIDIANAVIDAGDGPSATGVMQAIGPTAPTGPFEPHYR